MKSINTLVQDIYSYLEAPQTPSPGDVQSLGQKIAAKVEGSLQQAPRNPISLSQVGMPCARKFWYQVNRPELAEKLRGATRMKFMIGHILEEVLLWLAKQTGHTVEREQETVTVAGVEGHLDAIVDGRLVDCKSASTPSFDKFEAGGLRDDDVFGYINQLTSYASGTSTGSLGSFLVIDKTLGNICLDTYELDTKGITGLINERKAIVARPTPPPRAFEDVIEGKSGNRRLGVACSYCDFKHTCWPGLRTFSYARKKRVFLTRVVREPDVAEVK